MSAAVPGPNALSQRSTRPAIASLAGGGRSSSPSQVLIEAQRGREVAQPPAFEARTTSPAADNVVSTRGPIDISPPHDFPLP
jgi:hypothetical protein